MCCRQVSSNTALYFKQDLSACSKGLKTWRTLEFWLQKEAYVLKPGVEHGKLTVTVSGYMVKMCASPHSDGGGGGVE